MVKELQLDTALAFNGVKGLTGFAWQGEKGNINLSIDDMRRALLELDQPIWVIEQQGNIGLVTGGKPCLAGAGPQVMGMAPALTMNMLGDPSFCKTYGTRYAYCAGAMANGISSEEMVIALGKAGLMGSFGAGGVSPAVSKRPSKRLRQPCRKDHMPSTCSTARTNRCWRQGWLSST